MSLLGRPPAEDLMVVCRRRRKNELFQISTLTMLGKKYSREARYFESLSVVDMNEGKAPY
jgi:hypothetical protein